MVDDGVDLKTSEEWQRLARAALDIRSRAFAPVAAGLAPSRSAADSAELSNISATLQRLSDESVAHHARARESSDVMLKVVKKVA